MVEKPSKSAHTEPTEPRVFSSETTLTGKTSAPARLDKALADATDFSRARVQALIAQGRVRVNGRPANSPSAKVAADTPFTIAIPEAAPAQAQPQDIPLNIAFEDEHLIVINKPAGMVVHPAAGNADGTLVNALLYHCKGSLSGIGGVARPGIVHRIDKDTSGLLVAAKTDAAHEGLATQFAEHSVHRRYLAICGGFPTPAKGTIDARIGRSDANRKKMAVLDKNSSRGKTAITHYTVLDRLADASLIECRLETGRTHQVRVHCGSIGHALLGDPTYGQTPKALKPLLKQLGFARQALHAAELGFNHPVTRKNVLFKASLPDDMQELIDQLTRCNR
ncbi:MAG: RluA family pseudouridine synthase [Pseudomonadota bacterium]